MSNEIQWLAKRLRPFLKQHLLSYLCVGLSSGLALLDPLFLRLLIDWVIPNRKVGWLGPVALGFLLAYALRFALDSVATTLNFRISQMFAFKLRLSLLRKLQYLSAEYHEDRKPGETLHRLQVDVDQAATLSGEIVPGVLRLATTFCLVLTLMLMFSYRLTFVVLPLIPVFVFVRKRFHKNLSIASERAQETATRMTGFLEEHLSSIIQIQLLTCERREARRFAVISSEALRRQLVRRRTELFFSATLYLIIVAGIAGVLGFGSYQVISGTLTAGTLVAFYGYTLQLFVPFYGAVDIYSKLERVQASVRRLKEISDASSTVAEKPDAVNLVRNGPASVDLCRVSFGYSEANAVLNDLDLHIEPGERVAVVGPSGRGKSTLARLLVRLRDPGQGAVFVNGVDVRDIRLKSLRNNLVFIPQEPILFDLTLRENLLHGNELATEAELSEVLRVTQLEKVVHRLPSGWDETLGTRGGKLSGGERQRVAIARGLLQRPSILILDESTSGVDYATEYKLFQELDQYLKNVTVIVISHREYPLKWATRKVCLT
jgi:ABC-type multidrug transport system fused ATPase/permease subunit